jgi:citrate lyase synthetase
MYKVNIEGECWEGILFLVTDMENLYFSSFIDILYNEWKDDYLQHGLSTKDEVKNFYKKYLDGINFHIIDNQVVGGYNIHGNIISDVCVIPNMRGKGIGAILMMDAMNKLWYQPIITLFCKPDLIKFYEQFGFFTYSKTHHYIKMIKINWSLLCLTIIVICYFLLK